jgi:plastocyanin
MLRTRIALVCLPALMMAACDNELSSVQFIGSASSAQSIQLLDECDPASFNAALGAGTCTNRSSGVTFDAFNTQLNQTGSVAAWRIVPPKLEVNEGTTLPVMNMGGEMHTYTEVEEYGGGIVPALNQASGNTVEAPECAKLTNSDFIVAGAQVQHVFDEKGDEKYQCCIHPWMRQTVHVR